MSQPATEPPVQGTPESTDPQPQQPQETRAPYADYLEKLPETVRPLVEPTFKEWDASVTQRFQELQSKQDPWKDIVGAYQPDDVQGALQLAGIVQEDPGYLLQALAEAYPDVVKESLKEFFEGQGNNQPTPPVNDQGLGDLDPDDPVAKKVKELEDQLAQLTGNFQSREELEEQQQQQQYLDSVLNQLHEQHGEFDDTFILSQIAFANKTPDQAIQAWQELTTKWNSGQQPDPVNPPPPVIPSSGGVPSTQIVPENMDRSETKNLVAQLLEQANNQT